MVPHIHLKIFEPSGVYVELIRAVFVFEESCVYFCFLCQNMCLSWSGRISYRMLLYLFSVKNRTSDIGLFVVTACREREMTRLM